MCGLGVPPKFTLESVYPTWRVRRQGLWELIMSWGWVSELGGQAPIKVVPQDSLPSRWGHGEKLLAMNKEEAPHSTKLASWSWMFQMPWEINVCFYKLPVCMLSYSGVSDSLRPRGLMPARLLCPWDSPGKNTGVGCHFLLQGIVWPRDQTQVSWPMNSSPLHYLEAPISYLVCGILLQQPKPIKTEERLSKLEDVSKESSKT